MASSALSADSSPHTHTALNAPDTTVDARSVFGIDIDMQIPAFTIADCAVVGGAIGIALFALWDRRGRRAT